MGVTSVHVVAMWGVYVAPKSAQAQGCNAFKGDEQFWDRLKEFSSFFLSSSPIPPLDFLTLKVVRKVYTYIVACFPPLAIHKAFNHVR